MPTRNKIVANQIVFNRLDRFCVSRAEDLRNAGSARYISTEPTHRRFLIGAAHIRTLVLSPSMVAQQYDFEGRTYFLTAGFDTLSAPVGFIEESVNGAILTTLLSESEIKPKASPILVRQIVEVGQMGLPDYFGHDPEQIRQLFPLVQAFSSESLDPVESEGIQLLFCLGDRRRNEHWIDDSLASRLEDLAAVRAETLPINSLCKAVLDPDPSTLFLALYRSLEGLYAREKAVQLISELRIQRNWVDVAQILESTLGWRPREEGSLESLLRPMPETILKSVVDAFGVELTPDTKLHTAVAKRIYALRNSLVHYRPFLNRQLQIPDWELLSEGMTDLILNMSGNGPPTS